MARACRKNARRTVRKVVNNIPEGKGPAGKLRKMWLEDVENYLKKIGGWRKVAKDIDTWNLILKEARALHGP
jgi:hypothetical protein